MLNYLGMNSGSRFESQVHTDPDADTDVDSSQIRFHVLYFCSLEQYPEWKVCHDEVELSLKEDAF